MPPSHKLLFVYLWIAPHIILGVIALAMVGKGLVRRFPFFFSYVVFEGIQFGVMVFLRARQFSLSSTEYRMTFLVGSAVSTALRFAVIDEVFKSLLQSHERLNRLAKDSFKVATVLLLLMGIVLAALLPGPTRFLSTFAALDRTVSLLQCGLLILVLAFSRYFAILWHPAAFGIALGFGLDRAIELPISVWHSQIGKGAYWPDMLTMAAYHCATLIWLIFFLLPERGPSATLEAVPERNFADWNRELRSFSAGRVRPESKMAEGKTS